MTENTVNLDAPAGFEIRETVINKGYIDENGKFVQTDGDAQVEGHVQRAEDLN